MVPESLQVIFISNSQGPSGRLHLEPTREDRGHETELTGAAT